MEVVIHIGITEKMKVNFGISFVAIRTKSYNIEFADSPQKSCGPSQYF